MRHILIRRWYQLTLSFLSVAALFLLTCSTTFAADVPMSVDKCDRTNLKCVMMVGDKQIMEDQEALKKLGMKVAALLKEQAIDKAQAAQVQGNVTANMKALAALKTKLDAEKTFAAALRDAKSVHTQFRLFTVVLPRDNNWLIVDVEVNILHKLQALTPKLTTLISKSSNEKQAKLKELLADYKKQLSNARMQLIVAQNKLPMITVARYNADRDDVKADLKTIMKVEKAAQKDLHEAAEDLHKIIELLKK